MSLRVENWIAPVWPPRQLLEGQAVCLEPLSSEVHLEGLWQACSVADIDEKYRYLPDLPPANREVMKAWIDKAQANPEVVFHAVVDKSTGQAVGRQCFMRIDPANGVIELGNIYWGPDMARQRGATEAFYLAAKHVFDDLGYRRFEWKCDSRNEPSRKAALRFGFAYEGTFRQHMIIKGLNRDTAWFGMTDNDWRALKPGYQAWLDESNMDSAGRQKQRLESCIAVSRQV